MKKVSLFNFLIVALVLFAPVSGAIADVFDPVLAVADYPVDYILKKFDERIKGGIDHASMRMDYLREKSYYSAMMLVSHANQVLKDREKTLFQKLGKERQELLLGIERLLWKIEKMEGRIERLEELFMLDLHDLLNRLGILVGQEFLLMRVDGFSQTFQEDGRYRFMLLGNALDLRNQIDIRVGNYTITNDDLEQERKNVVGFWVPVRELNNLFQNNDTARVPFKIDVNRTRRRFFRTIEEHIFAYAANILLLPKYPVKYELVEHYQGTKWGGKWVENQAVCQRAGGGRPGGTRCEICIDIPPEGKFDWDYREKSWENSCDPPCDPTEGVDDFGVWGDWYLPSTSRVCKPYRNRIHDRDRTIRIAVSYSIPQSDPRERKGVLFDRDSGGHLPYGTSMAQFSNTYQNFTLKLKYFYGRQEIITGSEPNPPEDIAFRVEDSTKRLIFKLKK